MVYVVLIVALLIGAPIAISIIAALLTFMSMNDAPYAIRIVATEMYKSLNSYPLLAIAALLRLIERAAELKEA